MCTLKVLITVAALFGAHAGSVKETLDGVCDTFEAMGSAKQDFTADQMAKVFGEFASFFASKVDCSEDPYNPLIGFNLEGVTLTDCQAAKAAKLEEHPEIQVQLGTSTCIEKIVDEDAGTGAIWVEFGNTGAIKGDTFKVRGATRFSFDKDAKITGYHTVYDSYWLLHGGNSGITLSEAGKMDTKFASSLVLALFGTFALLAAVFMKRREQKDYVLLADGALA